MQPFIYSKGNTNNPNTAKNIFVFTDGKKEKKNGKQKRLVKITILDICNILIIFLFQI